MMLYVFIDKKQNEKSGDSTKARSSAACLGRVWRPWVWPHGLL